MAYLGKPKPTLAQQTEMEEELKQEIKTVMSKITDSRSSVERF